MVRICGIRNCDTMKQALKWLSARSVANELVDYKTSGIDPATLQNWEVELGWEALPNRRGLAWRKVPDEVKAAIDRDSALKELKICNSLRSCNECRKQPEDECGEYTNDRDGNQPGDENCADHGPMDFPMGLCESNPKYSTDQDMGRGYR